MRPEPERNESESERAQLSALHAPRPLVVVIAEPEIHATLAADPDFDVHPDRYASYHAFLAAARARAVPLHRSPVVVVCSDALHDMDVSLGELLGMVRDVAVVIAWTDAPHNGVIAVRDTVTANSLRAAIGQRLECTFAARDNGDQPLPVPELRHEAPMSVVEPANDVDEPIDALDALDALNDDSAHELPVLAPVLAETVAIDAVHHDGFDDQVDAQIVDELPPAPPITPDAPRMPTAPLAPPRGPVAPARPVARPAAPKLVNRAGAHASETPAASPTPSPTFWDRWTPNATGVAPESHDDFEDFADALDADDDLDFVDWSPRTLSVADVPEEITGPHAVIDLNARPFDLPPTQAELDGALFGPAPERDRLPVDQAQIITVYSPKGGVGKTSMAVNLAARLALRTKLQVCIVDLDLGFGNVGTRLGMFMPTVRELLAEGRIDHESVNRNLAFDPRTGLHALLAPLRPDVRADHRLIRPESFDQVLRVLADRFDVIVLDCPVELTDPIVASVALRRAHRVAMVLNNEQATLIDGRRAIETMCRARSVERLPGLGVAPTQIGLIFNQKVDGVGRDEAGAMQLLVGDDPEHPAHHIPVIASIPDDRVTWVRNANLGRPVATAGDGEIDTALDCALAALLPGAAELLGVPNVVNVLGVTDVWRDETEHAAPRRFGLRKRA